MKNENKNIDFLKDKPALIKTFLFLLCLIFLILLVYIAGALILTKDNYKSETAESDAYFKDCSILEKDCTDTNCSFYNSCGGAQKVCRIYDCGSEYGIFTKDDNGQINTKRKDKPDEKAIEAEREACGGSMEILEQNCVEGEYHAKVKVATKGKCEIGSFVVIFENGESQPNQFIPLEDNSYAITVDHCGTAAEISPVSTSGMYLEF